MATIKIDDKEYDVDNLSDAGKALLGSIQFVRSELIRIDNQSKIYKKAEIGYAQSLKEELEKK